jgi:phosphoenolpyruvate carboxykinase (GTP)
MATIQKNTIYTNVLLKSDGTVWWEDGNGPIPESGINWEGKNWKSGLVDENGKKVLAAHPNSRFTAPLSQCPSITNRFEHHHGVPITAIIFGGKRSSLAPLVYESFYWQHGVYIGATMASERTAAQYGKQGEVRRDPFAMLPFCGYNMGKYFSHWLKMGKQMVNPPKIFHVNWFRTDEKGQFLWPGFGENLRVLEWIIGRCRQKVKAIESPVGYLPDPEDIDLTGLDLSKERLKRLLSIDISEWKRELEDQKEFFKTIGKTLPKEILYEHNLLKKRISLFE